MYNILKVKSKYTLGGTLQNISNKEMNQTSKGTHDKITIH